MVELKRSGDCLARHPVGGCERARPSARTLPVRMDGGNGQPIARSFVSPDGLEVLVGKDPVANEILTFHLASPWDFWLQVRGTNGAHVVVPNPQKIDILPEATLYYAAGVAALNSEMIRPRAVRVQLGRCGDVRKPKCFPPGKVLLLIHEKPEQETPTLHR